MIPFASWAHLMLEGAHGVDLFFVLSGFCLSYPVLQSLRAEHAARFNITRYFAKRIVRIVPPYYAAIALLVLVPAMHPPVGAGDVFKQTVFSRLAHGVLERLLLDAVRRDALVLRLSVRTCALDSPAARVLGRGLRERHTLRTDAHARARRRHALAVHARNGGCRSGDARRSRRTLRAGTAAPLRSLGASAGTHDQHAFPQRRRERAVLRADESRLATRRLRTRVGQRAHSRSARRAFLAATRCHRRCVILNLSGARADCRADSRAA